MTSSKPQDPAARSRSNLIGLGLHAAAFMVFGAGLVALNLLTTPGLPWFSWTLVGWGLGLTMHAVGVFRFETLSEEAREEVLAREQERRDRLEHARRQSPMGMGGTCGSCGCGQVRLRPSHTRRGHA